MLVLNVGLIGVAHLHAATGSDNAGNYSTWNSGDNQGTGFGPWTFENVNGGWFLGDPTTRASNLGTPFTTSGNTFGLWSSGDGTLPSRYAKALRSFASPLATNDRFKISLGYQWDNGQRGFNLFNGLSEVFNLNINASGMTWTGGGSYGAIPWGGKRENGVQVDVAVIKTATGFRFSISSPQDSGLNGTGSVIASGLSGFAVYVSNAGGAPSGQSDFNFNNLLLDSVQGDVTPPTITLNGDKLVQVAVGGTYTPPDPAVSVSDDVTTTANIVVTASPLDTSTAGLKTITYTAKDEANNDASVTRVVLVGDLTASTADAFYNLHYPTSMTLNPTSTASVYGQIFLKGATEGAGQTPNVQAWIGVNSANTDPSTWDNAVWKLATYNSGQTGNNDEYSKSLAGADYPVGNYYYATRWQVGAGAFAYGGTTGPWNGTTSVNGALSVIPVRDVTFAVDMNVQIFKGTFIPTSGQGVELKGSFNNGWNAAGVAMSDVDGNGIYTVTLPIQGNASDSVVYKFRVTGSALEGLEWEGSSDRPLVLGNLAETLKPVTFSNDGTTFAVWSGGALLNAENLAKYAIGGASGPNAQGEAPTVGKRFIVPNHYTYIEAIVRTDDSKLSFLAEASTDLSAGFSSTGRWTVEGTSLGISQLNVPTGCERKRFIYWHGMAQEKMFLRLKATLAP